MTQQRATPKNRRTLARFIKLLGACAVPMDVVKGKTAPKAWAAADYQQQRWVRNRLFRCAALSPLSGRCTCDHPITAAQRSAIFKAYRSFLRTGKAERA